MTSKDRRCTSLRYFGGVARVRHEGPLTAKDREALRVLATVAARYVELPEYWQFWFWAGIANATLRAWPDDEPVARMVSDIASEPEEAPLYKGFQSFGGVGQGIDRVDYVHGDVELPPYPARGQAWRVEHELWRRVKRLGVWGYGRRAFVQRQGRATLLRRGKDPMWLVVPDDGEERLYAQSELQFFDRESVGERRSERAEELAKKRRQERREQRERDKPKD